MIVYFIILIIFYVYYSLNSNAKWISEKTGNQMSVSMLVTWVTGFEKEVQPFKYAVFYDPNAIQKANSMVGTYDSPPGTRASGFVIHWENDKYYLTMLSGPGNKGPHPLFYVDGKWTAGISGRGFYINLTEERGIPKKLKMDHRGEIAVWTKRY